MMSQVAKSREQRLITKERIVVNLMLHAIILFHPHGMSIFITEALQFVSTANKIGNEHFLDDCRPCPLAVSRESVI